MVASLVRSALLLFALIAIPSAPVHAQGFFDCILAFTTPADVLSIVDPSVTERLEKFPPGSSVRIQSGSKQLTGWVQDHSLETIRMVNVAGEVTEVSAKKIQLSTIPALAEAPPFATALPELVRLHRLRVAAAKVNPVQIWESIEPSLTEEIKTFRKLGKNQQIEYLQEQSDQVLTRIQQRAGTSKIGFHYNLNGGVLHDFMNGGLRISRGDIQHAYGSGGNPNMNVYYFQGDRFGLFNVLNENNPRLVFPPGGRMGNVLTVFRYDGEYFDRAKTERGIIDESGISFDFNEGWVRSQALSQATGVPVGIPATEYLAPPALVFTGVSRRAKSGRLSRNEETLAVLRYLDVLWTQHSFLPTK